MLGVTSVSTVNGTFLLKVGEEVWHSRRHMHFKHKSQNLGGVLV